MAVYDNITFNTDPHIFDGLLKEGRSFNYRLSSDEPYIGTVRVSGGSVDIINNTGLFDQLLEDYVFENGEVIIKRGYTGQEYSDFLKIGTMNIRNWQYTEAVLSLKCRNKLNQLYEDIPKNKFALDNTLAWNAVAYNTYYPEKLLGRVRPVAWGQFNVDTAPEVTLIRLDEGVPVGYTTTSKDDTNMSVTAPAYHSEQQFTATSVETNDDGYTTSVIITTDPGAYLDREVNFYKGYIIRSLATGGNAYITSYSYNPDTGDGKFHLKTSDTDMILTDDANFTCIMFTPVAHFFIADNLIKSIEAVYVDGESWIWLDSSGDTLNSDGWSGVIVPIPGYTDDTEVRVAFTSKDINSSSVTTVDTMDNHSDILKDILTNSAIVSNPFSVDNDIDTASFAAAKIARKYPLDIYLDKPTKVIDVIAKIRRSVVSKLVVTNTGDVVYTVWGPESFTGDYTDLTDNEYIRAPTFSGGVDDVYYNFVVEFTGEREEKAQFDDTKYKYGLSQTKKIDTYLRHTRHARRTAERYSYFYRDRNTKATVTIPHNLQIDGTTDDTLITIGEYVKLTAIRAPSTDNKAGSISQLGLYRSIFEINEIQVKSNSIELKCDVIKGLITNAAFWKATGAKAITDADYDPEVDGRGFWCNSDGEATPGDVTTKNISLWS
jgi:hypothetical protein